MVGFLPTSFAQNSSTGQAQSSQTAEVDGQNSGNDSSQSGSQSDGDGSQQGADSQMSANEGDSGSEGGSDAGGDADAITSIKIFYRYVDTGDTEKQKRIEYKPNDSSTYPNLFDGRYIKLSATITFGDQSTLDIDESSDLWTWKIVNNVDDDGKALGTNLVVVNKDAEVESRDSGSGMSYLSYSLLQFPDYELDKANYLKVKVTATPAEKKKPKSIDLYYVDADHQEIRTDTKPLGTQYSSDELPSITTAGNNVQFYAKITFTDGTSMDTLNDAKAPGLPDFKWSTSGVVDYSGQTITKVIPKISDDGKVTAVGQGNGFINVKFSLTEYSKLEFDAQVRVSLDETSPYPTKIKLYMDEGLTKQYSSANKIILRSTQETTQFFTQVTWSDGTKTLATYGEVKYSIAGTVSSSGEEITDVLARVSQTGIIRPLQRGDGIVTIKVAYQGTESIYVYADVTIMDNAPQIMAMDMDYVDDQHTSKTAYNEKTGATPEIREKKGNVRLIPSIVYTSGVVASVTAANFDWSIEKTTTLKGKNTSETLATVNGGYVFATAKGDGIVYVRCTYKNSSAVTGLYKVEIRGNSERVWVKKVEVLDSKGKAYGDNSINLETYGIVQLYARVTYSDGTIKNTYKKDVVDDLVWGPSVMDGATIDETTGQFIATKTFQAARVTATVKGGGFYEQDVKGRVWIQIMKSTDEGGTPSDSLTISVVYEADYKEKKMKAKPVFTKTYTTSEVTSTFPMSYTTYTFSKGPSDVNGEYTKWGVLTSYGFPLTSIVSEAGVKSSDLLGFRFVTNDNYNPSAYSTYDLLGTRYAYPNFSIGIENGKPSSAGAYTVQTTLALNSFVDYDTDQKLSPGDYSKLSSKTRFRLCMGLTSTTGINTFDSARNVNQVVLIVKDGSYGYGGGDGKGDGSGNGGGDGDGSGDGKGSGGGNGDGNGNGNGGGSQQGGKNANGDSNSSGGMGNDEGKTPGTTNHKNGTNTLDAKESAGGKEGGSGGDGTNQAGNPFYLRKIVSKDTGSYYVEDVSKLFVICVLLGIGIALLVGAARSGISYGRKLSMANMPYMGDSAPGAGSGGGSSGGNGNGFGGSNAQDNSAKMQNDNFQDERRW